MIVLIPALRGCGTGEQVGQTFGLRESLDVKAAVDLLRNRHDVNPQRIALVGIGTGATAAAMAAMDDGRLTTLALFSPCRDIDQAIANHVTRSGALSLLTPLCKWTFEVAYQVSGEELGFERVRPTLAARKMLLMDVTDDATLSSSATRDALRRFLTNALTE